MKQLAELKRKRALAAARLRALASKEAEMPEGEQLPADELSEVENLKVQIAEIDGRVTRLEEALAAAGEAAQPVGGEGGEEAGFNGGRQRTSYGNGEPVTPREGKGFKAARFAVGILVARGSGLKDASEYVERRFGDKEVAKALNTTGVATGGALIPQAFSNEIIELLRAETVIRKLNPMIVDMPMGNLTIPRLAAGATAGYQGELDDMSASQETFDDLQLNAKKLTALVPVSNDLIRRAPANIEAIVRDDMTQSLARREDLAFMLGDGSGNSPIGLLNLCAASAKLAVLPFSALDNATILTAVNATLLSMRLTLVNSFSRMVRPAWIFTPTTEAFLLGLRDNVGNFVYKDEMEGSRKLWGIRYETTQQLPTNLTAPLFSGGTAADGSYIFLADFADVILAETYNMVVDASDVAAYKDAGGNMVSTFTRDQTAFRIITEHDFNLRHQASVCVGILPAWAPAGWTNFGGGAAFYVQAPSGDMSAAPSTWGIAAPTGSNNPGNSSANAPGGTQPGRP